MSFLSTKLSKLIQVNTTINSFSRLLLPTAVNSCIQERNYAARKGTRERKRKTKVKVEIKKVGFIPHNLRDKEKRMAERRTRIVDDSLRSSPVDDVYVTKYYKWIVYPFGEAIQAHRETHHPEMYNKPNAEVFVSIELNMQTDKKTRFVENFKNIVAVPHKVDQGADRTAIVFAKDEESLKEAANAGAQVVGGLDLVKQVQNGQVFLQDFEFIIAHPDILPELVVLRGLMKKRFPNTKMGTLDINLGPTVDKFLNGISYEAIKDEYEKSFGQIDVVLGTLDMDERHLEENFAAIIQDVNKRKTKRNEPFIRRCLVWSPPSREKLKINHELYLIDSEPEKKEEAEQVEEQSVTL